MSLQPNTNYVNGTYDETLYQKIKSWEAACFFAYLDAAKERNPTIGIGFNLRSLAVFDAVATAIGFDTTNPREQYWYNQLWDAVRQPYQTDDSLHAALNGIMIDRWADTTDPVANKRPVFEFYTESEMRQAFNQVIPIYEALVTNFFGNSDVVQSNERIALVSMAYTSRVYDNGPYAGLPRIFGNGIKNAIANGDRAEAWYEIRYNSNKGGGHAARRYKESDLFNLYNPGPLTEYDYKSAYRTFTRHRDAILAYEGQYSPTAAGVTDINGKLAQAAEYLLAQYEAPGIPISWENIYVGEDASSIYFKGMDIDGELYGSTSNDLIFGESGNDTLYGLAGDDILEGGADNDWLYGGDGSDVLRGGAGNDTYFFSANDSGIDRIEDSDNQGRIVFDDGREGPLFAGGLLKETAQGSNTWQSIDGKVTLTHNSPWTLSVNGVSVNLGESFETGDFGISLSNAGSPPTVFLSATSENGSYLDDDSTGPRHVDGGSGKDMVFGASGDDELYGKGGDDWIYGDGGADRIDGGSGNDLITGLGGNSRVEGGDGNDVILASATEFFKIHETVTGVYGGPTVLFDDTVSKNAMWYDLSQHWTTSYRAGRESGVNSNGYLTGYADAGVKRGVVLGGGSSHSPEWTYEFHIVDEDFIAPINRPVNAEPTFVWYRRDDFLVGYVRSNDTWAERLHPLVPPGREPWFTHVFGNQTLMESVAISGGAGDDLLGGGTAGDSLLGGVGTDYLYGNGGGDVLEGGDGNDSLAGGAGDDAMGGGVGNDLAYGETGADTIFGGDGNDELWGDSASPMLAAQDGDDVLEGGDGDDQMAGQGGDDLLLGGADNDQLFGGQGNDVVSGGDGNDWVQGGDGTGGDGNDSLLGGAGDDILLGEEGDDYLSGGDGVDELVGGPGADVLEGGAGDDVIFVDGEDRVIWNPGDGNDIIGGAVDQTVLEFGDVSLDQVEITSGVSAAGRTGLIFAFAGGESVFVEGDLSDRGQNYALGGETFTQSEVLQHVTRGVSVGGSAGADIIFGTAHNDTLYAGDGNDSMFGYAGDDLLDGGIGSDVLEGGDGSDNLRGQAGDDTLRGGGGTDFIFGFDGADVLDGGTGGDVLEGGAGSDTYLFNRTGGSDTLRESQLASIPDIDVLRLGADVVPGAVSLHRDGLDLVLVIDQGTSQLRIASYFGSQVTYNTRIERIEFGNGTVWGTAEIDARVQTGTPNDMIGGPGNDLFVVDDALDTVTESPGAGIDTVQSSVTYSLPENVENLTLTGVLDLTIKGNALDNTLRGNVGNNVLDGRDSGLDTLIGGAGDDVYWIGRDYIDRVIEGLGEGIDLVVTRDSYALPDNVEDLKVDSNFTPYLPIQLTGNGLNNRISGPKNSTAYINGGAGADSMAGGDVTDVFYVDDPGDIIVDPRGGDHVYSSISYTLTGGLEQLYLTGDGAISGTGDGYHNVLDGSLNAAANVLTGMGGNDLYRIGDGDMVVEDATGGTDTVEIAERLTDVVNATYALGRFANIENLRVGFWVGDANLTGDDGSNWLTGNTYNNVLVGAGGDDVLSGDGGQDTLQGGAGSDRLYGQDGNDTLDGGVGNDLLSGGLGSDSYRFGRGYGGDEISESDQQGSGSQDVLYFVDGIRPWEVGAFRVANDLLLNITGSTDFLRVTKYFEIPSGFSSWRIEEVRFGDGTTWNQSYIEANLISSGAPGMGTDFLAGTPDGDTIAGLAGEDVLHGGGGNDLLDGGADADLMYGGSGADTYVVDEVGDMSIETEYGLVDTVRSSVNYALGDGVENLVLTGASAISGTGNIGDNVLDGSQNDSANVLAGSDGSDRYIVGLGDIVVEEFNAGTDTVESGIDYVLPDHVEHLVLTGVAPLQGTGNAGNNDITGNGADNRLFGGAGGDRLYGGTGNDWLDGGVGSDNMQAGLGDDTYVVDSAGVGGDAIVENSGEGTDTVRSTETYTLTANVEDLVLMGRAAINGTGNILANRIFGNGASNSLSGLSGNDYLDGGAGTDTLSGGVGDDTYIVDDIGDMVYESSNSGNDTVLASVTYTASTNVENLTLTGYAAINATGNTANNLITGNVADNTLDGGWGADVLSGGAGDDTYVVDNTADVVVELVNEGKDTVRSSVSYILGANLENLVLTGTNTTTGTGDVAANMLDGSQNTAANVLRGGAGNDTYVVGSGDTAVENVDEGFDTVISSVSFTLGANVEQLTLTGNLAVTGTGNAGTNVLDGTTNAAANTLAGGAGNDIYIVGAGDTVVENADGGTDTVQSDGSYALTANVENLLLTGTSAVAGTGNALNNTLDGSYNPSANVLAGGSGNDTYVLDGGDAVEENANEGTDTVQSAITYTLGANVENLTLTGTAAINGTGNALNNTITGNAGDSVLTGGAGDDTVSGGDGNDRLYGGDGNDTLDAGNGTAWQYLYGEAGNDTLRGGSGYNFLFGGDGADSLYAGSGYSFLLGGAGNDTLTAGDGGGYLVGGDWSNAAGTGDDTLIGGLNADTILGGDGNDVLTGGAGDDELDGGAGNDSLQGGAGNDFFTFGRGYGSDMANAYDTTVGKLDVLQASVNALDLVFAKSGGNLVMSIHGDASSMTVQSWDSGSAYQTQEFTSGDGKQLLNTQVDQLIQAMARFSATSGLAWDQAIDQRPQEVQAVLAAYWQPAA